MLVLLSNRKRTTDSHPWRVWESMCCSAIQLLIHSIPLCCPGAVRYRNVDLPTSRSRPMLSMPFLSLEISERVATPNQTVASRPNRDLSVKDIESNAKRTKRPGQRSRSEGGRPCTSVRRLVRHFDSERARDGGDGDALDVARRFFHPVETTSKVRAT